MGIVQARYNMVADLYRQTIKQTRSGNIQRTWTFDRQISCIARGVTGGGIRVVGSTERWESGDYSNVEWVKMQTGDFISKRDRIYNIKTKGETFSNWAHRDEETDLLLPLAFEVLGSTPIQDPFGRHVEYDVLLTLAEEFATIPSGVTA